MATQIIGEMIVPSQLLHLYSLLVGRVEGDLEVLTVDSSLL